MEDEKLIRSNYRKIEVLETKVKMLIEERDTLKKLIFEIIKVINTKS